MLASAHTAVSDTLQMVTTISLETIVVVVAAMALAVYGVLFGKYRLVSLLWALKATLPVLALFPYMSRIPNVGSQALSQLLAYSAVVIVFHLLGNRIARGQFSPSRLHRLGEALLLACVAVGLAAATVFTRLPGSQLYTLSDPYLAPVFSGQMPLFWWLISAITALALTSQSRLAI